MCTRGGSRLPATPGTHRGNLRKGDASQRSLLLTSIVRAATGSCLNRQSDDLNQLRGMRPTHTRTLQVPMELSSGYTLGSRMSFAQHIYSRARARSGDRLIH